MRSFLILSSGILVLGSLMGSSFSPVPAKEFLTPAEIEKIQDARDVDKRIQIYLEAAALRLKTAEERLNGRESAPGDPLEFFSVEDMLEGYYGILKSVMFNLDDAAQNPRSDRGKLNKALKNLKSTTEKAAKDLKILKRMAEEKKTEEIWNLVTHAMEITDGAHEGAELGLARFLENLKPKKQP